jgi:hypothetical protein
MRVPTEIPDGFLVVPFGKGCILLFTPREIAAGIPRGEWRTQIQAEAKRKADTVIPQTPRAPRTLSTLRAVCSPTGVSGTGTRSRAGGSR